MPVTGSKRAAFRFGVFELDPTNGELRKHGLRLRLADQQLQILAALLERPGEVVTRTEIQKRLWPAGTYVDYDNAINGAVRKLRTALGDTADCARFIETLARRGYRFIAPVSTAGDGIPTAKRSSQATYVEPSIHLIGREQERTELLHLLNAAMEGQGSMALIGGEPGIGKTHLTRAVLGDAVRRGCFAITGHCYEMEGSPPYVPFIEMLEYSARVSPRETFREAIGDCGPEIAKLMPELRRLYSDIPTPVDLPPERQRRFLFNAYREFVERAAQATPIVAAFEDLHWADESTLFLLGHLTQTVSRTPMLIIGTYRDTEIDARSPFARALAEWIREKAATRISLGRLDSPEVASMLAVLSAKAPSSSLVRTVFERTDGNPFFVQEVFRYLSERGDLVDKEGVWRQGEPRVPPGVRLVIGHRLERLQEETRRLLTKAAVIGRSFNLRLLEHVAGAPPDTLLRALEEAERAHLITAERNGRETGYRFVHELMRETLYETLTLPRRQQLHAHIADAIEQVYPANLGSHASAVAHHLYQAGGQVDLEKTVSYLALAARLASTAAAHQEALTHIDNALSLLGTSQYDGAAELHATRAIALRSARRWTEAIESYERAINDFIARADGWRAAEASLQLVYIHCWNTNGDRALAVINRVLPLVDQSSFFGHRLLLLKALVFCLIGEMTPSLATLSEVKEVEERSSEPTRDGFPSMCEARIRFAAAQLENAGECGRKALSRFRPVGDLWGEAETFEPVAAALWTGHPLEVEDMMAGPLACAEKIGHQNAVWAYRYFSAQLLMAQGDLEKGERTMREVHEFALANSVGWRFMDYFTLGAIAHYRGNLDEALIWIHRGIEMEPPSYQSGHLSGMLFWTLAAKGDVEAEAALSAARVHLPVPRRPLSLGACGCLALVMEGLAFLGRFDDAAALKSSAESVVVNGPLCLYSQHLFRTSAGIAAACARDWAGAEEHHRIAIHQADSSPYRLSQPGARYWYAEMLLARAMPGDREQARELLSEALTLHTSMGMKWHIEKVAARITQLGGTV